MPTYNVYLKTGASTVVKVEADGEEAAVDAAYENLPYVCAQCAGMGHRPGIEIGEWEPDDRDPVEKVSD